MKTYLLRAMSGCVPNTFKYEDFTCFLGNPFQCLTTFMRFFFLISNWNFLFPIWCPLPLVTSLCTMKYSVHWVPYILASGILQTVVRSSLPLPSEDWTDPFLFFLEGLCPPIILWLSLDLAPKFWCHSCPGSRWNGHLSVTYLLVYLFFLCCWSLCSWKLLDVLCHIYSI